jgi:hypothetical protein
MTVAELIKELTELCGDRDPSTIEVQKVTPAGSDGDIWGSEDWSNFYLETAGGNAYPFTILIK